MKNLLRSSVVLIAMLLWGNVFSAPQMKYWVLSPKKVDFTGASPSGTNLPTTLSNATYITANGVYDESGAIIFFVRNDTIFNSSGGTVGKMQDRNGMSGRIYAAMENEIAIAPVPGSCSDFFIIYGKFDMNTISGWGLLYTKVSVSGGTVSIVSNSILVKEYSGDFGGIALGKYVSGISGRKLYAAGASSLDEYYVTSASAVSWNRQIVSLSSSNQWNTLELELNHAGTMLAWGQKTAPMSIL